ncbi:hypothetical protein P376_4047 [Streptomyces sp. HCCB10043]|nr:hypothetical protein P376_4047 [Streptomyces sp. HCCB10043]
MLRGRVVEQVRTHEGVLPVRGTSSRPSGQGEGTRARSRSKVSLT